METFWNIINIITAVITVARIIVVATETKKDDVWLEKRLKYVMPIIKALQLGFGNSKG
tara:strand:- start:75 stop:248 length:174 start_codon:yes stop_codon:yes gene_type:complete